MSLLLVPLVPLLLALSLVGPARLRAAALALAPWAALPALAVALAAPSETLHVPWLLLGARLGVDELSRAFLSFTAIVWTAAGVSARAINAGDSHRERYAAFHLLALAGNMALIVAGDAVGFYLGFALMTFAAYGLVVHDGSRAARRAGRVYIVMAVLGEAALLAGLLLAVAVADGAARFSDIAAALAAAPGRGAIIGLLMLGLGVKAGVLPVHVWLPLAHPVAPTPASAVLSGCMIKAGLLGWLRFLPLGEVALPDWGVFLVAAGVAAAYFGAVVGVAQNDAKTVLAYSSISQMGFMTVAVGIALIAPHAAPACVVATAIYAAHHGLAKGALFLGTGVAAATGRAGARRVVLASLWLPALALAGAPLTSGMVSKGYLAEAFVAVPWLPLAQVFAVAAAGTTLLMLRFLYLVAHRPLAQGAESPPAALSFPYAALLAVVGAMGVFHFDVLVIGARPLEKLTAAKFAGSLMPLLAGAVVAWTAARLSTSLRIAPGDLLFLVERPLIRLRRRLAGRRMPAPPEAVEPLAARWYGIYAGSRPTDRLLRLEIGLTRWEIAALLVVCVVAVLFAVTWMADAWAVG